MQCELCGGETQPVNLEGSVVECIKCRHRRHIYLPDLDLDTLPAVPDGCAIGELPRAARTIFEDINYDA